GDARLCNMQTSRRERPFPVAVDAYHRDLSVYGVRGLAGNARQWTATEEVQGTGTTRHAFRVIRGGHWNGTVRFSRSACRGWDAPIFVSDLLGFRLAASAGGA